MQTWRIFWSPEGRCIAEVQASSARDAKRQTPRPYRQFMGEVYVAPVRALPERPEMGSLEYGIPAVVR